MEKTEVIDWALAHGWHKDRFGHLHRMMRNAATGEPKQYRLKLSRIAARYEVRVGRDWVRVRSGYYSALYVDSAGELAGLDI